MGVIPWESSVYKSLTHRIHGAAIYGNMDPFNIPPMLAYIAYMDPMGNGLMTMMRHDETPPFKLPRCSVFWAFLGEAAEPGTRNIQSSP